MRKALLVLLFAMPFMAVAQTKTYRIEAPAKDSFFLIETVVGVPTKDVPKPQKVESSQLFRSEEQLLNYIQYLKNQAAIAKEQSKKVVLDAKDKAKKDVEDAEKKGKELEDVAPKIEAAAISIEQVAKASRSMLRDEPKTVVKTKKKKS